jgi:hypothetical protein
VKKIATLRSPTCAEGRAAPQHPTAGADRRRVTMTETAPVELLSRDLSGLDVAVS